MGGQTGTEVMRGSADRKNPSAGRAYGFVSKKKLAAVIHHLKESVVITDSGRKIVYVNPAAEKMLGYSYGEMVGRPASRFFGNVPGNPPDLAARIAREATPDRKWEGVVYDRDREGNVFAVRLKLAEVQNGVNVGYVGISSVLEEEQPAARRNTSTGLAGELPLIAAGIAHDFNNLLQIAELNLSALEMACGERKKKDAGRLTAARKSLEACGRLSARLLSLAHSADQPPCRFELNRVADQAAALLEQLLPDKIRLRSILAENLPTLSGHPLQIQRLIFNLGKNAREAMISGGEITLTTSEAAPPSGVFLTEEGVRYVKIEVKDQGGGIPAGLKKKVFEPFFTTKKEQGGTGLGLSVAEAIVRAHGGYLNLARTSSRGTVFEAYLPACSVS